MNYLRVRIDGQEGYLKAFENQNKNGNRNAPDFKGQGIAIWENQASSKDAADQAAEAGAASFPNAVTVEA